MLTAKQPCLLCNLCAAIYLLTAHAPLLPRACKWTSGRSFFFPHLSHPVSHGALVLIVNKQQGLLACSHATALARRSWASSLVLNLPYPPGRSRVSATLSSGGHGSHTVTCPILPISCACSNPIAQLKHLCAMCKMLT